MNDIEVELGSEVRCVRLVDSEVLRQLPPHMTAMRDVGHIGRLNEVSFTAGLGIVVNYEVRGGTTYEVHTAYMLNELEPYVPNESPALALPRAIDKHRASIVGVD